MISEEYVDFSSIGNSRRLLLEESFQMANCELLKVSSNLNTAKPKFGLYDQWANAAERVRLTLQLLKEVPDSAGVSFYVGRIREWLKVKKEGFILFEVAAPESYTDTPLQFYFKVKEQIFAVWQQTHPEEVERRKKEDISDLVEIKVRKGAVLSITWIRGNPYDQ